MPPLSQHLAVGQFGVAAFGESASAAASELENAVTRIELRCARDLSLRLGATMPETTAHHRQLRDQYDLLVGDP